MPRDDLTEIICIIDRSGSMDAIRDDAIGGFNAFLAEQQKVPGDANLTMMLFDEQFLLVHQGMPIGEAPELNETTFVPRGSTALHDAIGRTINETEARIGKMDEADRPGKVLVLILTDGMENASKEFDKGRIQKVIKDHEAKGWEFMYLKAGPDTFDEARAIGIDASNYANIGATSKGIRAAYRGVSSMACAYRAGGQSAIQRMSLQDSVDNAGLGVDAALKAAKEWADSKSSKSADNATTSDSVQLSSEPDDGEV